MDITHASWTVAMIAVRMRFTLSRTGNSREYTVSLLENPCSISEGERETSPQNSVARAQRITIKVEPIGVSNSTRDVRRDVTQPIRNVAVAGVQRPKR